PPLVIDGPFAETKEQLLGFYIVDCTDLDDALGVARELGKANPGGAYEIRPLMHLTVERTPAPAEALEDVSSEAP
ncbi:MAG TPA: YciI family protein, partial [Caulobacteraceae bacterium]|nr:YciI family protein [Caulobacteraceae bacterium]